MKKMKNNKLPTIEKNKILDEAAINLSKQLGVQGVMIITIDDYDTESINDKFVLYNLEKQELTVMHLNYGNNGIPDKWQEQVFHQVLYKYIPGEEIPSSLREKYPILFEEMPPENLKAEDENRKISELNKDK